MNWKHLVVTFLLVLATTTARPSDTISNDQPSDVDKQSAIRSALLSRRYLQPNLYSTDSINPLDPIFVKYKDSSNHVINDFFKKSIPFLLHGTSRSFTNFPKSLKTKLNSTKPIVNKLSKIKTKPPDDDDDQESRYGVSPYADRLSYYDYHKPPAAEVNIVANSGTHYYSHHYPSAAVAYQQKPSLVTIPSQVNIPTTYYQELQTTTTSPRPPLPPPFSTRPYFEIPRPIKTQTQSSIQQKPVPKPTLLISSRPTPLEYRPINDIYVTTERPQLYAHRPTYTVIDNNSYPIRKNNVSSSYTNFMTETFNGYDYMRPPSYGDLQPQSFGDISPQSAEVIYLNNTLHILKKPVLLGTADPEDPDPSFLPGYNNTPYGSSGYGGIIVEDAKNATNTTANGGDTKKCSNVKITVTDSVSFQVNQNPCEDNINVNVVSTQSSANDTKSATDVSAVPLDDDDDIGKKAKKGKKKKQKFRIKKKKQKFKKKKKEPTPIELTLHHPEPELVPVLAQVQQPHLEVYDKKKKKGGKRKKGNKIKGNKKRKKGQQTEYVYVHDEEEDYHYDHYEHDDDDHGDVYEYEVKKKYKKKPPAPQGVVIQHQIEHIQTVAAPGKQKKKRKKKKRKHKPDDEQPSYIIKKPEYAIIKKPHKTHDHFKELLYQATKYVPVIILALLNPMTLLAKALIFLPFKFFILGTAGLAIILYPFISSAAHTPKKSFRSHPGFTIHHDHRHKFLSKRPPPHWRPHHKWRY